MAKPNNIDSKVQSDLSMSPIIPHTPLSNPLSSEAYPSPQSMAKSKTTWTSSDLDTPEPRNDKGGARARSKKRALDEEVVYVDSESDSEDGPKKKTKGKAKDGRIQGGARKKVKGDTSSGRKVGSWTREEIRSLWEAMFVPPTRIDWEGVSAQVPKRDKLSCSNKWRYDLLPKVQAFIDSLGE